MTDVTRDWIAKCEHLEEAATEGPWRRVTEPGTENHALHDARDADIATDYEGVWYDKGDAEFIADARTSLPAAVVALKAVLELHRPVDVEPSDTICGECSFQLPSGRYFGKVVGWPCPTARAIEDELKEES